MSLVALEGACKKVLERELVLASLILVESLIEFLKMNSYAWECVRGGNIIEVHLALMFLIMLVSLVFKLLGKMLSGML